MGSALSTVGESVAAKMAEKQKETMAAQRDAQAKMMEANIKRQVAIQMAATRERLNWQLGFWLAANVGVAARFIKTKTVHPVSIFPVVILPYIMAYQADLAYGNKMDRIKAEADRILVRAACAACLCPLLTRRAAS